MEPMILIPDPKAFNSELEDWFIRTYPNRVGDALISPHMVEEMLGVTVCAGVTPGPQSVSKGTYRTEIPLGLTTEEAMPWCQMKIREWIPDRHAVYLKRKWPEVEEELTPINEGGDGIRRHHLRMRIYVIEGRTVNRD